MPQNTDLKVYLDALSRHWILIGVCAALACAMALGMSYVVPPTYEASVGVVVIRSQPRISFTEEFETLSQEEMVGLRNTDLTSRRKTLAALARSAVIESEVQRALVDELPAERSRPGDLLDSVTAEVIEGELVRISVRTSSAALAARVANLWGAEYESYVNRLYGERPEPIGGLQEQAEVAQNDYEMAQAQLERFYGDNQIAWLQGEISHRESMLTYHYDLVERLDQLLDSARVLRSQWEGAAELPGTAPGTLGLLLLQANSFEHRRTTGLDLSIDEALSDAASEAVNRAYLASVIESWEDQRAITQGFLDSQLLARELLELRQQLEHELALEQELVDTRDLALKAYQTLNTKLSEEQIASKSVGSQVKLAMPAIEPRNPVAPRKLFNGIIGGLLGFICGVAGTAFLELRQKRTPLPASDRND